MYQDVQYCVRALTSFAKTVERRKVGSVGNVGLAITVVQNPFANAFRFNATTFMVTIICVVCFPSSTV